MSIDRKRMGDKHEEDIAKLFKGRQTRGSGNQWRDPGDGGGFRFRDPYAFTWDCKSTLASSIGVSRAMWEKLVQQSHGNRPMLPLRFYDTERLHVGLDLVVLSAHDMAEILEVVNVPQ